METNEELINAARRHKEERGSANINNGRGFCGNCSQSWPCITRRLADALEAATTEWEYGYNTGSTVSVIGSRSQMEYYLSQFHPPQRPGIGDFGSRTMRRRKAGPWIPVEGESSDEA